MRKLTLFLTSLLLAAPVLAAVAPEEGAHGGGEGSINIFAGDLGNSLWTLVIFGVLLWVLGRYAWGPILSGLQGREQFIRDALQKAKDDRDAAEERLREYEAKLATARHEVDAMLEEARRDADVLRQREEQRAKEEGDKIIARARREIEIASETAVKDLYARATQLVTDASSRVLGRELTAGDHDRLVRESIAAVERMESH